MNHGSQCGPSVLGSRLNADHPKKGVLLACRFTVGRWIGLRLLVRYGKYVGLDERRLKVGQYLFHRHGGKIVFFGRFVDLLRILAAALAGANRMSWPYFLLMNAMGGICWVLLLGGGAYLFGEQMKRVAGPVQLILLIVAIGLAASSLIFFRHHEKELVRRAESTIPGLDGLRPLSV